MKNQYVRDLTDGVKVLDFFQVKEAARRTTKNGKGYLSGTLRDKTGNISFVYWGDRENGISEAQAAKWTPGALFNIQGTVEKYNERPQVRVEAATPADALIVDAGAFEDVSPVPIDELKTRFKKVVDEIQDRCLAALVKAVFSDKNVWERFMAWPAASTYHHAYKHGLIEHTVSMARMAVDVASSTNRVDKDLLIVGCLVHDIGKIYEFAGAPPYEKTDEGRLLGHLFMGARLVETKAEGIKDFPKGILHRVLHMIVSHHDKVEFGSPVAPATPEALALHRIDDLDARLQAADYTLERDATPGMWTDFNTMLETKLYRGAEPKGKS